ncbi:MAG: FecR domain-containing protein [Verrucomicrobia bacterium]|nr:FecR domain-containing protein [Verrucomicrobiota bacterium]
MKKFSAVKWFALALVCAGVASNLYADTAKVVHIKGAARYSAGNNVWQPLHVGDVLKAGAVIQTASESVVDLIIGEESEAVATTPIIRRFSTSSSADVQQNIIRLRENTVLALDKLSSEQTGTDTVTDTQLDLRAGRIFGNVKKLSAASRYEIKLPNGVAGIRGTFFDLTANGLLTVYFGSVVISFYDASGHLITKTVNAGWELDLTNGNTRKLPEGATGDELPPYDSITPVTYTTEDHTVITVSPVLGDNRPPE